MKDRTYSLDSGARISRLATVLVIALALLLVWGIILVRDKLLLNANNMGGYLAQSYAVRESNRFAYYEGLLSTCADYFDQIIERGGGEDEIVQALVLSSEGANDLIGRRVFDMYAVIGGKIYAATPWEGDEDYDYASTEWYASALESYGPVYTDIYTDVVTGSRVVTLAQRLSGDGNVLATDILLDSLSSVVAKEDMPKDSSFYLIDSSDEPMFVRSTLDLTTSEGRGYLDELVALVRSGGLNDSDATIIDLGGSTRGVYFFEMENGWLSIVTIPLANILQDGWSITFVILGAICALTILFLFLAIIRERRHSLKNKEISKTLRMLGDRHYAIYQINLETGCYRIIKAPPDLPEGFAAEGPYSVLLGRLRELVESPTYKEFNDSFSLASMRGYVRDGVEDYGGDFQRRFGDVYRWVNVRCVYSRAMGGNEVLLCFRDVEGQKHAELQHRELLENALKAARQTEARKNTFFSGVSHDMRTPLNAIVGLSSLLVRRADDPDAVRDYAEKINSSGEQLLALVNDILELSRLDATAESRIDVAPLDLARCLSDCVETLRHQIEGSGKSLSVIGLDRVIPVYGDSARLAQIFNNLLSNAVKYTNEGDSIRVELKEVSGESVASKYQITVADTGIGMSEEFLEHLFEPFSRETRFAPANVVGTGLGMPIVRSLVLRMSGEVTVESKLGVGTTFVVTLPLLPANDEEVEPAAGDDGDEREPVSLEDVTVLVAEDNEINMEVIKELLEIMGASVVPASDGEEAVRAFSGSAVGEIDVILMDMYMPNMNGCDACRAIRGLRRADAATVPIFAVTANAFAEDIAMTTRAGMNGHLTKPVSAAALCDAIGGAVSAR